MVLLPHENEIRQRLLSSCPVLDEMLTTGNAISSSGDVIPTAGFSTVKNLVVLRRLMEIGRFQKTLEIGLAHGGSALTLASAHRDLGHAAQNQHVAIDPFQNEYLQGAGIAALNRAGLMAFVRHESQLSQTLLPTMVSAGEKRGLIYIDGSHSFDDAYVDFYFCDRLLEVNGYLVFDDCADYRVRKVTCFIERNYSFAYKELRVEDLLKLSNSLRLKAARILGRNQVRIFQRTSERLRAWDSSLKSF